MWAIRAVHEASRWENNCFITLTYNQDNIPGDGSLVKSHFVKFMKKLRQWRTRHPEMFVTELTNKDYPSQTKGKAAPIRYIMCGEYGTQLQRPHYHALLFNLEFKDKTLHTERNGNKIYISDTLEHKIWKKGFCSIGNMTYESAAYVARYIIKKQTGTGQNYTTQDDNGQIHEDLQQEYATQSRKPGIASHWFDEYGDEVFPEDEVIIRDRKGRISLKKPPRYYEHLISQTQPELLAQVKAQREKLAKNHLDDQTPKRLKARETVKVAQLGQCKRTYETGET